MASCLVRNCRSGQRHRQSHHRNAIHRERNEREASGSCGHRVGWDGILHTLAFKQIRRLELKLLGTGTKCSLPAP